MQGMQTTPGVTIGSDNKMGNQTFITYWTSRSELQRLSSHCFPSHALHWVRQPLNTTRQSLPGSPSDIQAQTVYGFDDKNQDLKLRLETCLQYESFDKIQSEHQAGRSVTFFQEKSPNQNKYEYCAPSACIHLSDTLFLLGQRDG